MKKTLLALAVCSSLIPAAFAGQVDLYGNVDIYVGVNNTQGQWRTGVKSGGLTASHWGLKGTEDLGGGTQVFFNLDNAFLANSGAATFNNEGKAFSREANVGIRGKYGQFSMGRQYTPHFLVFAMYDPTELSLGSSDSPFFFPGSAAVTGQDGQLVRMNNTAQYVLPTPFGLTNFFFIGLGEHKDSNRIGNTYNYAAKYDAGKFSGMVSYMYRNISTSETTKDSYANQYINAAISYDFGVTKPVIQFTKKFTNNKNGETAADFWMAQIGTATPVAGGKWAVSASYMRNQSVSDANAWGLGTKYIYPLSKRTRIYAGVQALFNDSNAGYAIEAGPDSSLHFNLGGNNYGTTYLGKNVQEFYVGINHAF
jgi:predicted porin